MKVFMQVRFAPQNVAEFCQDSSAALYFQAQLYRQFIMSHTELMDQIDIEVASELAALEVAPC
jgi:hypothetical protein